MQNEPPSLRPPPSSAIYFLHFTALWFLVVASIPPFLLPPFKPPAIAIATHPSPRRNFECFSRIRIGRSDSAVGQSAAVDTHSVGRQTDPNNGHPRPRGGLGGRAGNGGPSPRFWVRKRESRNRQINDCSLGLGARRVQQPVVPCGMGQNSEVGIPRQHFLDKVKFSSRVDCSGVKQATRGKMSRQQSFPRPQRSLKWVYSIRKERVGSVRRFAKIRPLTFPHTGRPNA